ncbi:MAG: hypothetical protein ACRC1P_11035 [Cellulosilyticaceae bacterium]
MALERPLIDSLKVINATKDNVVTFFATGDQFVSFVYEIYNNTTLALIKSETIYSSTPLFGIAANLLSNGTEYKTRVKTQDNSGANSQYSDFMILKCHSEGTCSITNLNLVEGIHQIKNQQFTFRGQFTQTEGVSLKAFKYAVYDTNRVLIKEYPLTYQYSGYLEQTVTGLNNYTNYYVELKCIDQYDRQCTSGLIACYTSYRPADLRQVLTLVNDKENASIKIESDIRQLIFRTNGGWHYENGAYINLTSQNAKAYLDDAFTVGSDFTMQAWVRKVNKGNTLIVLKDIKSGDRITISYNSDKRFHAVRTMNNITSHYISDVIDMGTRECTLWVRQVGRRIDLKAEVM